jgi:antitoxin component YwqK of YwqJK toxin-antitoxin module
MKSKLILCLALVLSGILFSFSTFAQTWSTEDKRAFVEKCLHDTNTFVLNVPADQNPHRNMPLEEIKVLWDQASRNGTILYLYPDGLPQGFWSSQQFKKNGVAKSWYHNGQLAVDELYEDEKLVAGNYYDEAGRLLGKMTNGTGRQLIYFMQRTGSQNKIDCAITEYRDGLKNGIETDYSDFAKEEKLSEAHYKNGKQNGMETGWDSGHKTSERNFIDGQVDLEINWNLSGHTNSITNYHGGHTDRTILCFYPDGGKSRESFFRTNELMSEKNWFTNGVLMSEEFHDTKGMRAKSYDFAGRQTGEVVAGNGLLVVAVPGLPGFEIQIYRDGKMTAEKRLRPYIKLVSDEAGDAPSGNVVKFHLEVLSETLLKTFSAELRLPDGVTSTAGLFFTATNVQVSKFKPFEIKFPMPYQKWTGDITADVNLKTEDASLSLQPIVLHREKP